jgi:hypothetical protein
MIDLSPAAEASLAKAGHVYCAGTLSQCLYRWNRLATDVKAEAFLKVRQSNVQPIILQGEKLEKLAAEFLEWDRRKR